MLSQVPIHPGLFTAPDDPRGLGLLAGRCPTCSRLHFPAAPTCPYCAGDDCSIEAIGARGQMYLYTVVNARPPGYTGPIPYGFGVVELPEGLRVISRIEAIDPEALQRGAALELAIVPLFVSEAGSEVVTWTYRPAPEGA